MGKSLREKAIMAMLGVIVLYAIAVGIWFFSAESVYAFKDAMDAMAAGEDEDGERIFPTVTLNGPNASKGKHRFDLDCQYKGEEEE